MNDQVSPSNPASPLGLHGGINSSNWEARFRSTSVESNLSLQSPIAESTNTLSRLIPQSPPEKSLPPLPASPSSKANFASPAQLAARNALSPGQRALLLKRTRKLEQMLGRPLDENQIERLVIDPHSARGALSSRVVNDTFPAISPSQADSVSKAAKRDARPRMVEALPPRSSSRSASRAASPLQSDRQENESSDDERKQLARAMRVLDAAANIDDVQRSRPDPSASPLRQIGRGPASLTAKLQEFWLDDSPVEDEATRRARRHQNAKVREYRLTELTIQLHRLLGVPIPPALVSPPIQDASRSSTPNDKSFFAFDEGPGRPGEDVSAGRVSKLRLRDKKKSTESSSFMDMRDFRRRSSEQIPLLPDLGDIDTVAARRKAWKLEQILGGTF